MRAGSPLIARLIGAALVFGSAALAAMSFVPPQLPWNRSLHVTVVSPAFGEMNPQAGVELGGVRVGSVERIEYAKRSALLHLAIDPVFAGRLHSDATATIQPHGLLGPKYVSLGPGSRGRLREGAQIPPSRTTVTTDFDQVLNALQPDVRQNLQVVFVELGRASDNRGTDMNQSIAALAQASDDLKAVTGVLQARKSDTTSFVNSSEAFNRDIQNAPIAENIADTNRVLADLVSVEKDLGDSIDHTAGVLGSLDTILNGNSANLAYVLAHAPGTVDTLNKYIEVNTDVVNGLRPSLPNLLTAVVEGESVVSGKDANGHFVRVLAVAGPCTAAPDPGHGCSSASIGTGASGPAPAASGSGPAASTTTPLTDAELSALFLGS